MPDLLLEPFSEDSLARMRPRAAGDPPRPVPCFDAMPPLRPDGRGHV